MLSKKLLKDIQSLSHKKHREDTGLFVAEGPKVVEELARQIPQQVVSIYALEEWMTQNQHSFQHLPVELVSSQELERISQLQTPNQVLMVAKQLPSHEPVLNNELALYLDTVQDPGNLGTIIRAADWFGIKNIVCSKGSADCYNTKVVQSTMASLARVNVWYDNNEDWLQKQTVPLLAAALEGESVYSFKKLAAAILLIGNESKGLRPELLQLSTQKLTIPRIGQAESLNAAVAVAILLSHLTNK